jgi:protein TonB
VPFIPVDDRGACANAPGRILPAIGVSLISHGALLLVLLLAFHEARQRGSTTSTVADLSAFTQLVWMPDSGAGGGGGGGGNQTPEPSRGLQRTGAERLTTPMVRTSLADPRQAAPEPEPAIVAPVLPLASDSLTLPGAMDGASLSEVSLGPGARQGAGAGRDGGIGSGKGPGIGTGEDGNFGGGINGGGAKLIMPTVVRSVKPEYTTEAMRARVQGVVIVRAIVQPDGTVRDVEVVRSLDPVFGLDQAAVRAAARWRFRPALMAGQPVPLAVTIELVFSLR